VTAKKNGTTTITAKTVNNKTATSKITVTTNPTGIKLNKTSLTIDYGKTAVITATISPSTSTNKTISWSSNNTSVATVDKNGKVTGKSNGKATITAKTSNGKTATCKVTIKGQEIITNIPIGEKIARFAAQISGYATGKVSTGGPHWPGWYPNSGSIFLHTGTGGTAKEYPNVGVGIANYKELPNNLTNLHDFWYVQDMTGRYPYTKKLYKTYWGKNFAYAGMWPTIFATYRATYDPLFNHSADYLESAIKKGEFTKITTTFAELDSVAKPGDFIIGGSVSSISHSWIWIGNKIVKQYWPKAPSTAKMFTASGQEGRWPNIVNSHYGCWNGNVHAIILRPTGKVNVSSSAPLVIDLNKYGLENSKGFSKEESSKRQKYCDSHWPHLSHK
ncbi:MAG: Ig domain-containing protein, partial [Clostridia bacterium]|nr:Ig domain-containing protein [Clostridia bacterium]